MALKNGETDGTLILQGFGAMVYNWMVPLTIIVYKNRLEFR